MAVHPTRTASIAIVLISLSSVLLAQVQVHELGVVRLLTPVPALLLLPAVAGTVVAIACENTAKLPLPDPPRAAFARAAWITSWTVLACVAVDAGRLAGAEVEWQASSRNVALHASLAIALLRLGLAHLAWVPTLGYMLVSMVFGFPNARPGYYWWALIMERHATLGHLIAAGLAWTLSAVAYVAGPRYGRRTS
ncbi:MAG: hypothetical protein HYR62_01590 [Actinobacteria bacterium]|nr:hypothetical protein [Actinomycetota bacterium]MBI3688869.1 hypothetical protein [Actinomycetota bacterium]